VIENSIIPRSIIFTRVLLTVTTVVEAETSLEEAVVVPTIAIANYLVSVVS
jgi:hypothetical protein